MKISQKGFTGLEIVLIVAVLSAVGAAGYFAFSAREQQVNNKAEVKTESQETKKESQTPEVEPINAEEAADVVLAFMNEYLMTTRTPATTIEGMRAVVTKYGTSSLVKYYDSPAGYNQILCGQNLPDSAYTLVSKNVVNPNLVNVVVRQNYSTGETMDYTVGAVKEGSRIKVNAIACPTS